MSVVEDDVDLAEQAKSLRAPSPPRLIGRPRERLPSGGAIWSPPARSPLRATRQGPRARGPAGARIEHWPAPAACAHAERCRALSVVPRQGFSRTSRARGEARGSSRPRPTPSTRLCAAAGPLPAAVSHCYCPRPPPHTHGDTHHARAQKCTCVQTQRNFQSVAIARARVVSSAIRALASAVVRFKNKSVTTSANAGNRRPCHRREDGVGWSRRGGPRSDSSRAPPAPVVFPRGLARAQGGRPRPRPRPAP